MRDLLGSLDRDELVGLRLGLAASCGRWSNASAPRHREPRPDVAAPPTDRTTSGPHGPARPLKGVP